MADTVAGAKEWWFASGDALGFAAFFAIVGVLWFIGGRS